MNGKMCPACGGEYLHFDQVEVAARREDGPFNNITVHAVSGRITTHGPAPAVGSVVGQGRRHRIVLVANCETCSARPQLVFTQHKGQTFVEWIVETEES